MNDKVSKAKLKTKKEKAESVAADMELEVAIKEETNTHVALKSLRTKASNGMVKKGESFMCTAAEYEIFKKHKAV